MYLRVKWLNIIIFTIGAIICRPPPLNNRVNEGFVPYYHIIFRLIKGGRVKRSPSNQQKSDDR